MTQIMWVREDEDGKFTAMLGDIPLDPTPFDSKAEAEEYISSGEYLADV